ncbi:MAG TPA: rhomboid family intramembrane serine protease [Mycobacteriales bacterium]|nr:rhomboid family intramembrane serine protease [Mycobacteriales bacterium]
MDPTVDQAPVCYRHPDRETYVRCVRCERPICPDCMTSAAVGFQCPSCVKEGHASDRPVKAAYGGRARSSPDVTNALLLLNGVLFLATEGWKLGFGGGATSSLFQRLALRPCLALADGTCLPGAGGVADGEYYRLLTSNFLHFGFVHLFLNMYCLYLVGPSLERALGRLRYATLYLLSGLAGSALSYALGPQNEMAAGASGAVFGLFAGFYVLERRRGADVSQITVTIGLNLVLSFAIAGIDWRGHVGGLVGGGLVTAALVYAPPGKQRALIQGLGCACVALIVLAVVAGRTVQLTG